MYKKMKLLVLLLSLSVIGCAQTIYPIPTDTLRVFNLNPSKGAELKLENSTKGITGALMNVGGGITQFQKIQLINLGDTALAIMGQDTVVFRGSGGSSDSSLIQQVVYVGTDNLLHFITLGSDTTTITLNSYTKEAANAEFVHAYEKGEDNGVVPLNAEGKIDTIFLPSNLSTGNSNIYPTIVDFGLVNLNDSTIAVDSLVMLTRSNADATYLKKSGGAISGPITYGGTPINSNELVNKAYADALASGLSWKQAVTAATTSNIVLSGVQNIDGIVGAVGQRILVKDQTDTTENGVYIQSASTWTRASDVMDGAQIKGMAVYVQAGGVVNGGTQWTNANSMPITVGTTKIYYNLFGGGNLYTGTDGIVLTGNNFTLDQAFVRQLFSIGATANGLSYNNSTGVLTISNIPNSALANYKISGISLGSNLANLTPGYAINGTSYNGSTAGTFGVDTLKVVTPHQLDSAMGTAKFDTSTIYTQLNNKVDKVTGKQLSDNNYTTTEKTKLAGIQAGAEVNVQSDWSNSDNTSDAFIKNKPTLFSGSYTDLTNKPTLFSGSYTDLTNKPSIPPPQVNSDWNSTSGLSQILNKPTLATVATTGSYTDLTNKPIIPIINDASSTDSTLYSSDKINSLIGSAGGGDMLKSVYDPTNANGDAFDYNNLHNKPTLLDTTRFKAPTSSSNIVLTGNGKVLGDLNIGMNSNVMVVDTNGVSQDSIQLFSLIGQQGVKIDSGTNTQFFGDIYARIDTPYLNNYLTTHIPEQTATEINVSTPITYVNGVIGHIASGITPGSYNRVTVDQYGHVTDGIDVMASTPSLNANGSLPFAGGAFIANSSTEGNINFPSVGGGGIAFQRHADSTTNSALGSFQLWTANSSSKDFFLHKYIDNSPSTWTSWMKIWTDANDGAGSGLDADELDGIGSTGFAKTGDFNNITGSNHIVVSGTGKAYGGSLNIALDGLVIDTTGMPLDTISQVSSVNSQTGDVTLNTDDIPEGTKKYDKTVTLTPTTGISVSGTYPNFSIGNTKQDQVVTITGNGATTVTGTYPNFTITSTDTSSGSGGGTVYSVFNRSVNGLVPAPGGATLTRYLREDGTWVVPPDNNTTYAAGTGMSLSGTTFNAQTTSALWNANKLQGIGISTTDPTTFQFLRYDGTNWTPYTLPSYLTSESDPNVSTFTKSLTSATALLTQTKTVDGAGSGLDADLLDGQTGSHYLDDKTVSISGGTGISVSGTYPNFTVSRRVADGNINLIESINHAIINNTTGVSETLQLDGAPYAFTIPAGTFAGANDNIMIRIKFLCDLSTATSGHIEMGINGDYFNVTGEQTSTFSNEVILTNYGGTGLQFSYRALGATGVKFLWGVYSGINITQAMTITLRLVSNDSGGGQVSIQPFTIEVADMVVTGG